MVEDIRRNERPRETVKKFSVGTHVKQLLAIRQYKGTFFFSNKDEMKFRTNISALTHVSCQIMPTLKVFPFRDCLQNQLAISENSPHQITRKIVTGVAQG